MICEALAKSFDTFLRFLDCPEVPSESEAISEQWNAIVYLNLSEPIWTYLNLSEQIQTYPNLSEPIWTYPNLSETIWTYANISIES